MPAADFFRGLMGVAEVEVLVSSPKPTHRIVHLRDWHFAPPELFAADVRHQSGKPLTDSEVADLYQKFLADVEQVQDEQEGVLRELVQHHGLRQVLSEGLTPQGMPNYREVLTALRATDERLAKLKKELGEVQGKDPEVDQGVEKLVREHRRQLLPFGAAGRLVMRGEVEVLPLDDDVLLDKAKPVGPDGKMKADPAAVDVRHDAQVQAAMASGPCSLLILGGGHDLSASVRRASSGTEYVRVTTRRYRELAEPDRSLGRYPR